MTDDRDPTLQYLFDAARQKAPSEDFLAMLMEKIDKRRRRAIFSWSCIGTVFAILAWLVTPALIGAVNLMTQILPQSLIEIEDGFFAQLLAPVNSFAMLVAAALFGVRLLYRKVFR